MISQTELIADYLPHGIIFVAVVWVIRAMKYNGWHIDLRIWSNGKKKEED